MRRALLIFARSWFLLLLLECVWVLPGQAQPPEPGLYCSDLSHGSTWVYLFDDQTYRTIQWTCAGSWTDTGSFTQAADTLHLHTLVNHAYVQHVNTRPTSRVDSILFGPESRYVIAIHNKTFWPITNLRISATNHPALVIDSLPRDSVATFPLQPNQITPATQITLEYGLHKLVVPYTDFLHLVVAFSDQREHYAEFSWLRYHDGMLYLHLDGENEPGRLRRMPGRRASADD